jgi:prepilin-type N-terminal cleavage/methylation domain-containing protein
MKRGFSLIELLIVLAIMGILTGIVLSTFQVYKKSQALDKDVETIVETLRQARSQTLSSQNASKYGVHITSTAITLFVGSTYSAGSASNQDFSLQVSDAVLSINLVGGGSDVVFNRLTGDTSQSGSVVISSASISRTKTVTIYSTGLVTVN